MKRFMSIVLTTAMLFTLVAGLPLTSSAAADENIIWEDDFSQDLSYTVETGVLSDGVRVMSNGARLLKTDSKYATGAYEVEATYNFSTVNDVNPLMQVADSTTGNGYAFTIKVSGKTLKIKNYYDNKEYDLISTLQSGVDYVIKVRFSFDSGEMQVYINGVRYLSNTFLQINTSCPNIGRIFDCQVSSNAVFTIDNLNVKKINWNEVKSEITLFDEDFEGGYNSSGYAAKPSNTNDLKQVNGSYAFAWSGKRLTTNHSFGSGKIRLSLDFTLASVSEDGKIVLMGSDSNGAYLWRLRVNKDRTLYAEAASSNTSTSISRINNNSLATLSLNTIYNIAVEVDTVTKLMNVYVNGIKKNTDVFYIRTTSNPYARAVDLNPDYVSSSNISFYIDNIKITKKQSDNITKIIYDDFANGSKSLSLSNGAIAENGAVSVPAGSRALNSVNTSLVDTASVYGAEFDISFTSISGVRDENYEIFTPQTVDGSNVYKIFRLMENNGSLVIRTYLEKDNTASSYDFIAIDTIEANKVYSFKYIVNLTTQRIHFYIDGTELYPTYQFYMNPACKGNFVRPADFNLTGSGSNAITVDNYVLYKDSALTSIDFDSKWQNGELSLSSDGGNITWYQDGYKNVTDTSVIVENGITLNLNAVIKAGDAKDMRSFKVYFLPSDSTPVIQVSGSLVSAECKKQDDSELYLANYKINGSALTLVGVSVGRYSVDDTYALILESLKGTDDGEYALKAFYWKNGELTPYGINDTVYYTVSNGVVTIK